MKDRNEFGEFLTFKKLINKGVEVGSFKGEFARTILEKWQGTLYMVDAWYELEDYNDMSNIGLNQDAYLEAMRSINEFRDRAYMLRCLSKQAVDLFPDESLDFVYIDANHEYSYVVEDIKLWYPKVKKGGIVAGHDYLDIDWYDEEYSEKDKNKYMWGDGQHFIGVFGVNPAVDEFCKENNIEFSLTEEFSRTWYFEK
jgi:hypothetical protein